MHVRVLQHVKQIERGHRPDSVDFFCVVFRDNHAIEVVEFDEVRVLKDELAEDLRSLKFAAFQVVDCDLAALHLTNDARIDFDGNEHDCRVEVVHVHALHYLAAESVENFGFLGVYKKTAIGKR